MSAILVRVQITQLVPMHRGHLPAHVTKGSVGTAFHVQVSCIHITFRTKTAFSWSSMFHCSTFADVDECDGMNPCGTGGNCDNTVGSYNCICNNGFFEENGTCNDVNECANNPCDINADCTNSIGSHTCARRTGFSGNGNGNGTCTSMMIIFCQIWDFKRNSKSLRQLALVELPSLLIIIFVKYCVSSIYQWILN